MGFSVDQFETPSQSEIVKERLREVCPPTKLEQMDFDEIERAIHVAFQIIGYRPLDLSNSIRRAYNISSATFLCDFIFNVWECDKDGD